MHGTTPPRDLQENQLIQFGGLKVDEHNLDTVIALVSFGPRLPTPRPRALSSRGSSEEADIIDRGSNFEFWPKWAFFGPAQPRE